ncbi:MAG TPA: ROK family protein [Ktedonobacteraceae bacterium]|nr:ROK family protein [Ktedonobacteraceae bacterium]
MAISKTPGRSDELPVLMKRQSGPLGATRTTGKLLATQGYVVGVEISGTGLRQTVAVADLEGKILHKIRRPLDSIPDPQTVLNLINDMLEEVTNPGHLRDGRILRVGVAVGGLVDARLGIVRTLHHSDEWNDFPLQDYMAERLEAPCIIDNNANAAALAEVIYGAGCEQENAGRKSEAAALYVGVGRGIGGGLVVNGHIYHGISSMAGEIGHMLVKENGPQCSCGGSGHLEAIASAQAITRRMADLAVEYPESDKAINRLTNHGTEEITAEQVFQLARQGHKAAQQVVEEAETYLGIALANIIHLINPSLIILGGQVAQAGDLLITPLQAQVHRLCLDAASKSVRIVQGKLGLEANIVGAVTLALQDL